jgi:hypothetical protein
MDVVYEFGYQPCIYESAMSTVSIHKTFKGAYKAMREHLLHSYKKWYDSRILYGKIRSYGVDKFGYMEMWKVYKTPLQE